MDLIPSFSASCSFFWTYLSESLRAPTTITDRPGVTPCVAFKSATSCRTPSRTPSATRWPSMAAARQVVEMQRRGSARRRPRMLAHTLWRLDQLAAPPGPRVPPRFGGAGAACSAREGRRAFGGGPIPAYGKRLSHRISRLRSQSGRRHVHQCACKEANRMTTYSPPSSPLAPEPHYPGIARGTY